MSAKLTFITFVLQEEPGDDISNTTTDVNQRPFFAYSASVKISEV
jgi:hypothetical protein